MPTTMYSRNPDNGSIVVHQLPYKRAEKDHLKKYIDRGYKFNREELEKPEATEPVVEEAPSRLQHVEPPVDLAPIPVVKEPPENLPTPLVVKTPEGLYRCGKCNSLHKETGKAGSIGQRHLKHRIA